MASVTFKVDTDRLNSDADQLMADIRKIITDVEEVNNEVNALSAMWKGEANATLTQSFNESHQWMVHTLDSIVEYAEKLSVDADEYNICEGKVTDLVSSI